MSSSATESAKRRINGSLMGNFVGKAVCLLGKAGMIDSSGRSFQLTTSDDQKVTVRLQEPFQDLIHDLIEVHGNVVNRTEILCSSFVLFPESASKDFDLESYDKAVRMMNSFPEHYITTQ